MLKRLLKDVCPLLMMFANCPRPFQFITEAETILTLPKKALKSLK